MFKTVVLTDGIFLFSKRLFLALSDGDRKNIPELLREL